MYCMTIYNNNYENNIRIIIMIMIRIIYGSNNTTICSESEQYQSLFPAASQPVHQGPGMCYTSREGLSINPQDPKKPNFLRDRRIFFRHLSLRPLLCAEMVGFFFSKPIWLVVSTHLKNIGQIGKLPQIGVKIKNI